MKVLKRILISFFVIMLVLLGLSKLFDFALRYNVNIKASYIQKHRIDAEIIFHGPCEPLWMISPKVLDVKTGKHSYNLALSHSDFADNYLHLYFYLKNNKAPEYMFLYVTPESMDEKYNTFNTYRFAPFLADTVVENAVKDMDPEYVKWTFIPFMKYAYYNNKINFDVIQGLKHFGTGRSIPYNEDGYEPPIQVVWDNHLEEFIQLYPHGYHFEWNKLREKYLCKTIELAKAHNIEVFLYESPVLKEALKYQPNRREIIGKIKGVAEKYGIKYVQFDTMKIAESRKYFMSTLNLNLEGSKIFTDSLGSYINTLK